MAQQVVEVLARSWLSWHWLAAPARRPLSLRRDEQNAPRSDFFADPQERFALAPRVAKIPVVHQFMSLRTSPKVIFFDAAGTLMFLPRPVGMHYAEVAARFGLNLDPTALDRAFHQAWKAMPPRSITPDGRAQPDDDKGWWRSLVSLVFRGAPESGVESVVGNGTDIFDFENYFEVIYDRFGEPGVWQAYPEAANVLSELRARGIPLGVISNFDRRLYANLEDIGLAAYFDHITISSEVGADKPHGRIFKRAQAAFDASPGEALHVGDDPVRDWAGAEAAGLGVFRLKRPENDLRALLPA